MANMMKIFVFLLLTLSSVMSKHKGIHYKVHCAADSMRVELVKRDEVKNIYLEHLKDFPEPACKAQIEGRKATFNLQLADIYQCMLTKVVNKKTGSKVYYHRVIVEYSDQTPKEHVMVKCSTDLTSSNNSTYDSEVEAVSLVKRQADEDFPVSFREDSDVEITSEVTGHAPSPVLTVNVRQDGVLIDDELKVRPGTPLNMDIYLDSVSSSVYGILVSGMEVTDTRSQTERILVNGCSLDPYLFENFKYVDGSSVDLLKAKFRAFKFPESAFVLFKGTVNVCLDKCRGVQCSNNQIGFGRRRRDVSEESSELNKVYEISTSTLIRLECDGDCEQIKETKKSSISILQPETAQVQSFKANEEAALSALFQDFQTPGLAVFEKSSSAATAAIRSQTVFLTVLLSTLTLLLTLSN